MKLVFASTVLHKSAISLIFEAEFKESALNILSYPECTMGPTLVGPEEKFWNAEKWLENAVLRLVFAHTLFNKRATLLVFEAEFT